MYLLLQFLRDRVENGMRQQIVTLEKLEPSRKNTFRGINSWTGLRKLNQIKSKLIVSDGAKAVKVNPKYEMTVAQHLI